MSREEIIDGARQRILAGITANVFQYPDLKSQILDELLVKADMTQLNLVQSALTLVLSRPPPVSQESYGPDHHHSNQNSGNGRYHPYGGRTPRSFQQEQPPHPVPGYNPYPPPQALMTGPPPMHQPMYQPSYAPYPPPPMQYAEPPPLVGPTLQVGGVGVGTGANSDLHSLFVFHLPPDATDKMLEELFSPFATTGALASVKVVKDLTTGANKGFGFVDFSAKSDAQSAIDVMNGYQLKNKFLKVSFKK